MKLFEDFKFRDDLADKHDTIPIEILFGPWSGTLIRFTKVALKETQSDSPKMAFDFEIVEGNKNFKSSPPFVEYCGLILNSLLLELSDGNTENNPEKSVEESGIHQEDPSVS